VEHRRRRPQSAGIEQTMQEVPRENEQGISFVMPAQAEADQQTRTPEEQSAAPRRRRRPQEPQSISEEKQEEVPQSTEAERPAEGGRRPVQVPAGRIPQLPHEDVRIEEERPAARSARRMGGESERIPKLPRQDVQIEKEDAEHPQRAKRAAAQPETTQSRRSQTVDAVQNAASAAASAGKKTIAGGKQLLGYLGGALLLLIMTAAEGISRLHSFVRKGVENQKTRIHEDGHAPQKQDAFELEAIRPADYHGSAQHRHEREYEKRTSVRRKRERAQEQKEAAAATLRSSASAHTKHAVRMPDLNQLLTIVFALIAIVSFFMIASILWRSVRTKMTNKKLAEIYTQASENTQLPEETPQLVVFMPEDETEMEETQWAEDESDEDESDEDEFDEDELSEDDFGNDDWSEDEDILGVEDSDPEEEDGRISLDPPVPTPVPMGKRIFHHVGGDALPQMEALHKENRDIVGWLKIENVLDLPVVYKDNSYYLTRDFYKQKNAAGTVFLDENHPFKEKTQNLLLHGHNMKDGTMFGRLVQYETDLNYVRWHPFVRFDTLWRNEEYVIFAVLRVSLDINDERFFNYFTHSSFSSDPEFESYIRQLQLRSIYAIPVDVKPTDALITLSTCLDEDRLVIVARRVREGETHTQLRAITNLTTKQ